MKKIVPRIKIVKSTCMEGLSVRAWSKEKDRWSANEIRALMAENFEEGDIVELRKVGVDEERKNS